VAFDDTDIELAKQMGTYFTAAYEILMDRVRIEKRDIVISRLNNLAERLSNEEHKNENSSIKKIFIDVVTDGLEILKPHTIVFIREKYIDRPLFIGEKDEKLQKKVITLIPIAKINRYAIGIHGKYNLLIVHKDILADNEHINIYIALTREDIWSRADLDYIFSIINSAIIYLKNILYLRAIGKTQEETLKMLGKALEMRDIETKGHTERAALLTKILAKHMGFKDMKGIMWGAYIHDIGKIAIPDRILLKPDKLTREEFDIIKRHVIYGYDLIRNIKGLPETTKNVVLYHHERWDGTGYMRGIGGENIPLEARIFAVVDVFDALISERPYKNPWSPEEAMKEIEKNAGTHFDPQIVQVFLKIIPQYLQTLNI
jgi:putative nucleotidyltransferase with HDIG domain